MSLRGKMLLVLPAVAIWGAGCEDKAIGRICDVQADAGNNKDLTIVNPQALECPTRICVRPAIAPGLVDERTTSLCSAECSSDSDCEDAERRSAKSGDLRCKSKQGFVCAVATEVGDFCCKKICMCRDFLLVPDGGIPTPAACMGNIGMCQNR